MGGIEHWSCPFCNRDATLQIQDRVLGWKEFTIQEPADGHKALVWRYVVCPNPRCKKFTLRVSLLECGWDEGEGQWMPGEPIRTWDLIPSSRAKAFPDYVPKPILDDYNEACLIVDLSPKASATLSRRCLQGILRNFWGVSPGNLAGEISQIKHKTDPLTWDAIDSVRKIGNVGAHMEKDIDLIVDVDPNEAEMLVGLIEILIKDWYVAREERRNRLTQIKSIADQKDEEREQGSHDPEN